MSLRDITSNLSSLVDNDEIKELTMNNGDITLSLVRGREKLEMIRYNRHRYIDFDVFRDFNRMIDSFKIDNNEHGDHITLIRSTNDDIETISLDVTLVSGDMITYRLKKIQDNWYHGAQDYSDGESEVDIMMIDSMMIVIYNISEDRYDLNDQDGRDASCNRDGVLIDCNGISGCNDTECCKILDGHQYRKCRHNREPLTSQMKKAMELKRSNL